jgi:hypothetical protein
MNKKLLAFLALIAGCLGAQAASTTVVTCTIAITNVAGTTNGQTLTVNSDTRTWTNNVQIPASQILTNSTPSGAAANLLAHVTQHQFTGLQIFQTATTNVVLRAAPNANLIASVSANWATLTFVTNTLGNGYVARVPYTIETAPEGTNIASGLAAYFFMSTNAIDLSTGGTNDFGHTILDDPTPGTFLQKRAGDGLTVSAYDASPLTNHVTWQVANYNVAASDTFVLLTGNHTATMPNPGSVSVMGRLYTIQCSSAGTNAILPNGSETFNGKAAIAAAKWTNSAVGNIAILYSNGTNWWVAYADN